MNALALHHRMEVEESVQNHWDRFQRYEMTESQYRNDYPQILDRLYRDKDRLILRFHPVHLTTSRDLYFDLSMMLDFDMFKFSQYDKIYITTRSSIDRVCSLYVASQTGRWTFTKTSEEKPLTDLPLFNINDYTYAPVKYAIKEDIVYEQLRAFFDANAIRYEEIDYDDAVNWARNNNLPVDDVNHVETGYDYSRMFRDYDNIPVWIERANKEMRTALGLL